MNRKRWVLTLLTIAFLAWPLPLEAELPPSAYREVQDAAPESLVIAVESVAKKEVPTQFGIRTEIVAKAKVTAVKHSASGLKPGDKIEIAYTHQSYTEPRPGPGEPTIVKEGETYPAFLSKDEKSGTYRIAARGASFRDVSRD